MIGKVQDMVAAAIVVGAADSSASAAQSQSTSANSQHASVVVSTDDLQQVQQAAEESAANNDTNKNDDQEQHMDENAVSLMTQELNDLMSKMNCDLEFRYHKEVNMMSVKMLDKRTQEVLKEVPPEEMIQHMIKARDWLGAFLDKNA